MKIHERQCFYFKADIMQIVRPFEYLKDYLPDNPTMEDYENLPSLESLKIYQLPSYEYINHKFVMSEFVKDFVDDNQIRRELFFILRRHDFLDMFCDCLKKYDLYDDFRDYSSVYYQNVFRNWCKENNISIGSN